MFQLEEDHLTKGLLGKKTGNGQWEMGLARDEVGVENLRV